MSNIVNEGEPSRTALHVATLRGAHQLLDEPLVLADPIALPILGAEREAQVRADPYPYNEPVQRALRAGVVLRSRFVEDELARDVAVGIRQYVVLGAGLDTFAYRNPYPAELLRVFEVDHPSTQQWKRQSLATAGIPVPASLRLVASDFEKGSLLPALAAAGFQADAPACFSWLGVTMYLTEAAVMDTLIEIARLARGSSVTFDFRLKHDLLNPVEQVITTIMAERVAALGEPWISAFDAEALCRDMRTLGFGTAEAHLEDALNRRYLFRRKDGLRSNLRLIHARV